MVRCSRLASLEIRGGPSGPPPSLPLIQEALTNATCKNLVRLCFRDWFRNDDHLIPILAAVPEKTLRDLKITNDIRHGTETIRLLVDRQSQSLERVEILQGWSVANKDMNLALLSQTCPRLQFLQYVPHSDGPNGFQDQSFRYEDRFYGIEFQDLLNASWVCLELEELQVMITNVPRKALSREWMWTFERCALRFSKED
ncbi:hypothetical protein BGZ83_000740 [Gryganskiella cystojenkinii]|nr:hypothetical protein BGZ83_000740 [Gryganskiella cystojenkinii]